MGLPALAPIIQPPRLIGYARISTDRQDTALQLDALLRHGVANDNIYTDTMSGARDDRPGLADALDSLRDGDRLIVWRIDRLGRSLRHLLDISEIIAGKGAAFVSLNEGIDLSTPAGRMIFSVLGAFAQFERDVIRERTKAGLAAAKHRGVKLGRAFRFPLGSPEWLRVRDKIMRGIPGHIIARDEKCSEATLYKAFPGGRRALLAALGKV